MYPSRFVQYVVAAEANMYIYMPGLHLEDFSWGGGGGAEHRILKSLEDNHVYVYTHYCTHTCACMV